VSDLSVLQAMSHGRRVQGASMVPPASLASQSGHCKRASEALWLTVHISFVVKILVAL
jgi:hypothetical protein